LKGVAAGGTPLAEAAPEALNPDLAAALAGLAAAGLLTAELAAPHALMTRMLVAGRLLAPDGREPPPSGARALARACGFDSYDALLDAFAAARLAVAGMWKQIFGTDILEHEQEDTA
jgi:glutamate-ammonia-ligase adenylyltransferase